MHAVGSTIAETTWELVEVERINPTIADYYVLFERNGIVRAADATGLIRDSDPQVLMVGDREYRIVDNKEDTFFFWDEYIDRKGQTVGFVFFLPDSPTLRSSRLTSGSTNVLVKDNEVHIDLDPEVAQEWDCVQGFGSDVYQAPNDPTDCVILLGNYSCRPAGFNVVCDAVRVIS